MSALTLITVWCVFLCTCSAWQPLSPLKLMKLRAVQRNIAGNRRRVMGIGDTDRPRKKTIGNFVANAGILAGGLLPGRALAVQRQPTAIVAESTKARQNPRDVYSGEKKTGAPEKDDARLLTKSQQKPTAADIKMGTSSFVSDFNLDHSNFQLEEQLSNFFL